METLSNFVCQAIDIDCSYIDVEVLFLADVSILWFFKVMKYKYGSSFQVVVTLLFFRVSHKFHVMCHTKKDALSRRFSLFVFFYCCAVNECNEKRNCYGCTVNDSVTFMLCP